MHSLIAFAPWLIAMGLLAFASAFFSASEAALFYLTRHDRRRLASGNRAQRIAAGLLADPDRLLGAVLFWNLLANLTYFTIVSITGLALQRQGMAAHAGLFAAASLLVLIVLAEMLPKSLAVLKPRAVASLVGIPLALLVRLVDPVLPVFRMVNLLSQRLIWPTFKPEPYLQVGDLERAVDLSTSDAALVAHEHTVLQGLVSLSAIRVDELMRPRSRIRAFHPPVALLDLGGQLPESGYLLLTEADNDEVAGWVRLPSLSFIPDEHLESLARPVAYVPWCTTVAQALETMQQGQRQVAAVVNELGETVGVLTLDDILDTIFSPTSSRSERLLKRLPIRQVGPGVWHVTGMTSIRRLVRQFRCERLESKSVTVAGVIQEALERLPQPGDRCRWGEFQFRVLEVPDSGQLLVELTLAPEAETQQ